VAVRALALPRLPARLEQRRALAVAVELLLLLAGAVGFCDLVFFVYKC
jgi:hypothetical protein